MHHIKLGVAVVAVALSAGVATAQPPVWVGGPNPPGQFYGYSPLVHTIEPFPSRTSPYAHSIFGPNGGKRIYYPAPVKRPVLQSLPVVVIQQAPPAPVVLCAEPGMLLAGPRVRPLAVRGGHRFAVESSLPVNQLP